VLQFEKTVEVIERLLNHAEPHRTNTWKHNLFYHRVMKPSFEQTLIEVWRQALSLGVKAVCLESGIFPVKRTPKSGLRQVDFVVDGEDIRGLEQNPNTKSRWAQLARSGKKVMQFLQHGRYVANIVDGQLTVYSGRKG